MITTFSIHVFMPCRDLGVSLTPRSYNFFRNFRALRRTFYNFLTYRLPERPAAPGGKLAGRWRLAARSEGVARAHAGRLPRVCVCVRVCA